MSFVKVPSMRHTVNLLGNQMIVTIPARRRWYQMIFITVWLGGWAVGELSVFGSLFFGGFGGFDLFTLAWLTMWTIGGFFAITALAWQIAGKEVVTIDEMGMQLSRRVLSIHWSKQYAAAGMQDLRVSPQPMSTYRRTRSLDYWGVTGGVIAFDYGSKTIRFGSGIDEAEAKQSGKIVQHQQKNYS